MPAPPPESEPAMVRAIRIGRLSESGVAGLIGDRREDSWPLNSSQPSGIYNSAKAGGVAR
jgi:hypothetical protein